MNTLKFNGEKYRSNPILHCINSTKGIMVTVVTDFSRISNDDYKDLHLTGQLEDIAVYLRFIQDKKILVDLLIEGEGFDNCFIENCHGTIIDKYICADYDEGDEEELNNINDIDLDNFDADKFLADNDEDMKTVSIMEIDDDIEELEKKLEKLKKIKTEYEYNANEKNNVKYCMSLIPDIINIPDNEKEMITGKVKEFIKTHYPTHTLYEFMENFVGYRILGNKRLMIYSAIFNDNLIIYQRTL